MYAQAQGSETAWDFSPVYDLINSLSYPYDSTRSDQKQIEKERNISTKSSPDKAVSFDGLGNFNKVWDFLGVTRDCPSPSIATFEASIQKSTTDAYASDGALYYPPSSKRAAWHDSGDSTEHAETQEEDETAKKLTKTQRKNANRRARKQAAKLEEDSQLEHDDEFMFGIPEHANDSNASKLSRVSKEALQIHVETQGANISNSDLPHDGDALLQPKSEGNDNLEHGLSTPTMKTKFDWRGNLMGKHALPYDLESEAEISTPKKSTPKRDVSTHMDRLNHDSRKHLQNPGVDLSNVIRPDQAKPELIARRTPLKSESTSKSTALAIQAVQDSLKKAWPATKSFQDHVQNPSSPSRKSHQILPLQPTTSLDRNWSLLNKLLRNFPEDRSTLLSPLRLSINRPQPNGIHVFVDASNIVIGFNDHLKLARGIPVNTRVGRIDLAFHSLALLLERRRPIAKRVLAGSTPEIPAFEEARQVGKYLSLVSSSGKRRGDLVLAHETFQSNIFPLNQERSTLLNSRLTVIIGYETNVLDKVLKAKELTENQRKLASRDQMRQTTRGFSTGDDTDSPYSSRKTTPKWVEQAVDEILHLKMMESIVDVAASGFTNGSNTYNSSPKRSNAPTMVLATGDAAEAEYSEGFMKQVERALKSGWNVEVVAWSTTISQSYRRWQKMGKERFKLIELDDYAEELFGTSEYLE